MKNDSKQGGKHENRLTHNPQWIVRTARLLAPSFQSDILVAILLTLECRTLGEYLWCSFTALGRAVADGMRRAFSFWLVFGEVCFLILPFAVREPRTAILPIATFLIIVLVLLRFRDAYSYPASGSPNEMITDGVICVALSIAFELACGGFAPKLALSFGPAVRASFGALLAAQWRLIFHRQDPPGKIRRNFLKRKIATWHMNILLAAGAGPIAITNVRAVPGGHLRDSLLGFFPPLLIIVAWRLKKENWTYLISRFPESIFSDPELLDLERQRALLPVSDRQSKVPVDVFVEVLFFLWLAYLPLVAFWRWVSDSPSAADVDWLQIKVNVVALVLFAALWIVVKKLNRKLADDLSEAIRKKKSGKAA